MWLRFYVAVSVAQVNGYSSDSTPSLGTSICRGCRPKKKKKDKINKMKDMTEHDDKENMMGEGYKEVKY